MKLIILGSGTGVPSVNRASPSCLLRSGNALALVDSGPGTLRQAARLGVDPAHLTDLLYTHAHLDHMADLWPLLFAFRTPYVSRAGRLLRLHGAPELLELHRRIADVLGRWVEPRDYLIELVAHRGQEVALGEAWVSAHPVDHIRSSVAYRIREGARTAVISGDTDYGQAIVDSARGADLLVLECSTPDERKAEGHLTPELCARIATEAGVGRLVLTHFYPSVDPAEAARLVASRWGGEVLAAEDLLELEV